MQDGVVKILGCFNTSVFNASLSFVSNLSLAVFNCLNAPNSSLSTLTGFLSMHSSTAPTNSLGRTIQNNEHTNNVQHKYITYSALILLS